MEKFALSIMAATSPARPCGFSLFGALGRIRLIGPFGRPQSGRKSCIAAAHSVRCSATRAPDFPQPGRAFAARPAALVGFDPSQCCSCHAGKAVRHPHRLAHLPFPVHPSRPIFAGRSIAKKPEIHPRSKAINHGCRSAAPGLCPGGQSVPCRCLHLPTGKADTALGLASFRLAGTDWRARGIRV